MGQDRQTRLSSDPPKTAESFSIGGIKVRHKRPKKASETEQVSRKPPESVQFSAIFPLIWWVFPLKGLLARALHFPWHRTENALLPQKTMRLKTILTAISAIALGLSAHAQSYSSKMGPTKATPTATTASSDPVFEAMVQSPTMKVGFARVTGYWPGEDYYTNHKMSATGVRLRQGFCAVDSRVIPYGSVVMIPGIGNFLAMDTGTAVINRKAARESGHNKAERNALVVDLYFEFAFQIKQDVDAVH